MTKSFESDSEPGSQNAVSLLMADHHRVKKLFADYEALEEDASDEEKSSIVRRICEELTIHTSLEEEIFYPAVREVIGDDALMDESLVEHAGAKGLIAQLRAAEPGEDLYDARVTVLSEQIDHHVTEEEGCMFPKATYAGADLEALGALMLSRKSELLAAVSAGSNPDESAAKGNAKRKIAKKAPVKSSKKK